MITTRLVGAFVEEPYYDAFVIDASDTLDVIGVLLDEETASISRGQRYIPVSVEELAYRAYADARGFIDIRSILAHIIYDSDGLPVLDSNGLPVLALQEV